jgi:hypothetical protein
MTNNNNTSSGNKYFLKKNSFKIVLIKFFLFLLDDLHFMKLAIEQANLSEPVETAYCVGAVRIEKIAFQS